MIEFIPMTEEEFRAFLEKNYSPEMVKNIYEASTAILVQQRQRVLGVILTLEEAEEVAKIMRKKTAVSISLIESGVAKYDDLIGS